jgi:hypothetical protein
MAFGAASLDLARWTSKIDLGPDGGACGAAVERQIEDVPGLAREAGVERNPVCDGQHVPGAADPAAPREHRLLLGERPLLRRPS